MNARISKTSGNRNRILAGFLRLFIFSLLAAALPLTSLHAQTVGYTLGFNQITVTNIPANTTAATIPFDPFQFSLSSQIVASPDGTRVYALFEGNANVPSKILVIDTASNTAVATISNVGLAPLGLAITPDGAHIYVADQINAVFIVDTATNTVEPNPIALGGNPSTLIVTADGTRVYVGQESGRSVSVINTATNTVVGSPIPIGCIPLTKMAVTPDSTQVYVGCAGPGEVVAISTATNTVTATIPFDTVDFRLAVSPDSSTLYVSGILNNSVGVVSTATNTLVATIPVGPQPTGIAVTPDGADVYVAVRGNSTLSEIDTSTNTVVATGIPAGAQPQDLTILTLGTAISKCPTVITQPGTYKVVNDLHCFNTNGIDIRADNVTLMLGGHTITQDVAHFGFAGRGVNAGVGLATGNTNVQIFGPGTITGFNRGVDFEQVSNSLVKNVTTTGNFFGFAVNGGFSAGCGASCPSTGNLFRGNISTLNNQHGFTMNGATGNVFNANTASSNGAPGFLLFVASGNNVQGNTFNNNGQFGVGITAGSGTGNNLHQNTAQNNGIFDLQDGNPNCDSNIWKQNTFGTASQPCIQ